jgi:hypothetical protein
MAGCFATFASKVGKDVMEQESIGDGGVVRRTNTREERMDPGPACLSDRTDRSSPG